MNEIQTLASNQVVDGDVGFLESLDKLMVVGESGEKIVWNSRRYTCGMLRFPAELREKRWHVVHVESGGRISAKMQRERPAMAS